MKKHFYFYYVIAFVGLIVTSCDKNMIDLEQIAIENQSSPLLITRVRKLENPYSVANMKRAYLSLQNDGLMKAPLNIEATHLYVRFLPKDSADLETLKKDTTLILFSYPLDYQLTEGEKYIDSTLLGNDFTWLYTRVPVGYISPISGYEVLEDLYLPNVEESPIHQAKQLRNSASFNESWNILEERSLVLSGNSQVSSMPQGMQRASSKWWPHATIRVFDDVANAFIPLQGVKVRARWWFNWESGITDSTGVATMSGSFTGKLDWSIVWERANWDIRDGWFSQAYYNGPNGTKSHWNLDINSGKSKAYANIHRAAFRHFYGDNLGMLRPINFNVPVQKICYIDSKGTGDYWANVGGGLVPDIRIYGKDSNTGNDKTSVLIFRTTSHELGHAVQCVNMGNIQFWQVSKIIYESWADAVEWALTLREYADLGVTIPSVTLSIMDKQSRWPYTNSDNAYSPLFIDLVDNLNQNSVHGGSRPNDDVTGYTMSNLSRIALKSYGLFSLKTNLKKNMPTGVSDVHIDSLFNKYEEVWK